VKSQASRSGIAEIITRSRAAALAGLADAVEKHDLAVLLTGEAGAGKSWLLERLVESQTGRRIWVTVGVRPGEGPVELFAEIARRMGLGDAIDHSASRFSSEIEALLQEVQVEGRRIGLIVEEVHLAGPETLEAIRQLAGRIRRPDGFDAVILSAQTGLLPRLDWRAFASLDALVGKRLHLRPLDADEAELLCAALQPALARANGLVEELHRDARGNAARLLRLAWSLPGRLERGRGKIHRGDPAHVLWPVDSSPTDKAATPGGPVSDVDAP
jgi:type II secretory pathway predicted ATPase ExeA